MMWLIALWAALAPAEPLERPGLHNFHRVSPVYYRGAQPTAEGMRQLEAMGVKTVINLRAFHSDRSLLAGTHLGYEEIRTKPWHAEEQDVVKFLRIVTDPKRQPVFVHCEHGADRTGMMTAIYRMVVEGWSKDDAVNEMQHGPYGFHSVWTNLVRFVRGVDVGRLRAALKSP
jgi:protein tyrosine/serine phosphatase